MDTYYRQIRAMGTRLDLVFPGIDSERGELVYELIFREVRRLESVLSFYDPDSELSAINKSSDGEKINLGPEMQRVLDRAFDFSERLNGYFDITLEPLIEALREEGHDSAIEVNTGMYRLELGEGFLVKHLPGMKLDLGGFGKGYALENIRNIISKSGISSAFISFGESSLYAHGSHPYGDCWKVAVSVPGTENNGKVTFKLVDSSLSVSGNSSTNASKYGPMGHICDPLSGKMCTGEGLVAVVCPSPLEAEVLSTALFCAGKEDGEDILKRFPDARVEWLFPEKGNQ